MNVDILVIMAHPDDAELCCSGTILASIDKGLSVGIIDLTKGELGTRGNKDIRESEANASAKLLKVKFRNNPRKYIELTDKGDYLLARLKRLYNLNSKQPE